MACVLAVIAWQLAAAWPAATAEEPPQAAAPAGNPLAPGCMKLLRDEIEASLRARNIEDRFNHWQYYMASRLDSSSGVYSPTEVTGNCRLSWYDHLMRHPLDAPAEAEEFTRTLHQNLRGDHLGLDRALATAREKMDCRPQKPRRFRSPATPEQALEMVQQALVEAQAGYAAALAPLTRSEIGELVRNLYPVLSAYMRDGHTLEDRRTGRRLCDLLEKMDRSGFYERPTPWCRWPIPSCSTSWPSLPEEGDVQVEGVHGTGASQGSSRPAGTIVIGGRGKNVYELDKMPDVAAVIDLGGDDEYYEGSCNFDRPVLVIIDLAGNDRLPRHPAGHPGRRGPGRLDARWIVAGQRHLPGHGRGPGLGLGRRRASSSTAAATTRYRGLRRVQGQALGGLGHPLGPRSGNDDYHAAMWAQGFGGPLGFGVLDDLEGDDHYYAGGMWRDSYPETPGYEGWGQGVGAGIRQVADGGIGVLLDGGGDDVYEFDYIAHGGGYWLGHGLRPRLRRQRPPPRRHAARPTTAARGPRPASNASAAASAATTPWASASTTRATTPTAARSWAWASAGTARSACSATSAATTATRPPAAGPRATAPRPAWASSSTTTATTSTWATARATPSPSISYHHLPQCGGNFSFLIDYGGNDTYGCGAANNSIIQRGDVGGFLIDRPSREDLAKEEAAKKAQAKPTAVQQDASHKKPAGAKPRDPVPGP